MDNLFKELADVFDGDRQIETHAREALLASVSQAADVDLQSACVPADKTFGLPESILQVVAAEDAHPVCRLIAQAPLQWTPPQTSNDPLYVKHSHAKAHVELLGPAGLVPSASVRLGLYGMLPDAEYGVRTHPAEEIYIMLAGQSYWKRGSLPYLPHICGDRSHHPSMLEHANRTGDRAFMSVYVWHGDISTDNYSYSGLPETDQ